MAEFDVGLESARIADAAARAGVEAGARFSRSGPVVGKAESHGVAVTVAPGGLLTGLTISRSALRSGPDAVAALITELAGRATRRAGDRMHEVLAPVLEEDQLSALGYERLAEDDPDAQHP
ncbi:YbaB/EbfC family DNA-binding protein [Amycolatopsis rhabdoformis]|uniref:YbaB/EbfC family DNA-binding protein n=1 Tax=Amycolatopsis rhabdoformis TaxID=1448059 RepID=A0ABZ1I753_9PSEU|nr:YbaB/EbfC family DNA-binding protein [Amycolatopsis rhabdoformis]WSE29703.1 YbaB/EbfC family DNA-binding protein [Amycolatopsis rhabdoformis]